MKIVIPEVFIYTLSLNTDQQENNGFHKACLKNKLKIILTHEY